MKTLKKAMSAVLCLVMLLAVVPMGVIESSAAYSMTWDEYYSKVQSFIGDSRWSNGTSWGSGQGPKLSSWSSSGCCAYAADFTKYVFGAPSQRSGDEFYNAADIRAGDVLYLSPDHWVAVLSRSDSVLYTAEGNCSGRVRITNEVYRVNGNSFSGSEKSFVCGYHYLNWNSPEGCLDICRGGAGIVFVRGWAFDRDNLEADINIHVYIGGDSWAGGAEGHSIWANKERADVNSVYGCGYYHGFDETISTERTGTQEVYVYAINVGNGENVLLDHKTVTITQHIHSYTSNVTRAATCSAAGVRTYTCSCGDSYTEPIPINSSNHVNKINVAATNSTCTVKGYTAGVYCNDCKKYISGHEEQPLAAHQTTTQNAKAATCTAEGYTGDQVCTVCKQTITKGTVIAKKAHTLTTVNKAEANCTTAGYTGDQYCTTCKQTITKGSTVAALGHADADSNGNCTRCGTHIKDVAPSQPSNPQPNPNACKYCGQVHTGPFGWLIKFFHSILAIFKR